MSVSVENTHWQEVNHIDLIDSWQVYAEFSPFTGDALTEDQQKSFGSFLVSSAETGVHTGKVDITPVINHVRLRLEVAGSDVADAIETSMDAALGGFACAGIDVEDMEFVAMHVASSLGLEVLASETPAGQPKPQVTDEKFQVNEDANAAWKRQRVAHLELSTLLD